MNNYLRPLAFSAFLGTALTAVAIPQSGGLSFGVSSLGVGGTLSSDTENTGWITVPSNLVLSADANSPDAAGASNEAYENGQAQWAADGNSGEMSMEFGWNLNSASKVNTNEATPDWTYSFIADQTGVFSMNYSVSGYGEQLFGLDGFAVDSNFVDPMGGPTLNAFDPSSSGGFTGGVIAGESYSISISNNGNVSSDGSYTASAEAIGLFSWQVTPNTGTVPDAGATSLLVGLGLAALVFVRKTLSSSIQ